MAKRKTDNDTSIDDILQGHTPEIVALVERLRGIVLEAVPNAIESYHSVWHSINFHHPDYGYFCGLFLRPDSVSLAFEFGILLPDPQGLLEGNGKQVKYVRVRGAKDIRARPLKTLLREAIDLPAERDVKLGMIRALESGKNRKSK